MAIYLLGINSDTHKPILQKAPDAALMVPMMVGGTMAVMSAILPNTDIVAKNGWYWLRLDRAFGSIGRASSNAQIKSDLLEYLFLELGGSQANWDAGVVLPIPDYRGRVIATSGQGTGLSPREPGDIAGEESHILTTDESNPHSHNTYTRWYNFGTSGSQLGGVRLDGGTQSSVVGGGQPFNILQPTVYYPSLSFLGVQV
jgi:hypothetical protein